MKHLLLFISIICSINCFAQVPDPNLFQTWYLYSVLVSDGPPYPTSVSEIEPSITPSITIMEDLSFSGIGACNSFEGTFFSLSDCNLNTDQFSNTIENCEYETHNEFESEYFGFMEMPCGYLISPEVNGMVLTISNLVFGKAIFKNFKLNTLDYNLSQIKIYSNPSNSMIHIKSPSTKITEIKLFNLIGQNKKTIKNKFEVIDISDLASGIYIIKVFTKTGTLIKKIYKK